MAGDLENWASIHQQMQQFTPLSLPSFQAIMEIAVLKELKKGALLAHQGQNFDYEIYIIEGVLRTYLSNESGREYTTAFYEDNCFCSPAFSRRLNGQSMIDIQAILPSKVLLFPEADFTQIRYERKDVLQLGFKVVEQELFHKSQKEVLLATSNLKELYRFFQAMYPILETKIPQRYVASYLGADPVSLSRLRASLK